MKKLFSLLLVSAMLSALLCGCGGPEETEAPEEVQTEVQTETGELQTQDTAEAGEQTEAPEASGETDSSDSETVVITADAASEVKDLYRLSNVQADSGASFGYLKSLESDNAVVFQWETPEGCTAVAVRVTVENLSQETVNFLDEVGGTFVFDSGRTSIATAFQENPGQIAEDGKTYPSAKAVPLEKGQTAVLWLIGNVPSDLLNSGEGLHAYFLLNDGTMYDVDMRTVL